MSFDLERTWGNRRRLGVSRVAFAALLVAPLAGCNDPPKPPAAATDAGVHPVADAATTQKPGSDRKQKIEAMLTEMIGAKGVVAKTVTCPDDAADHFMIKCPIVTGQGEKVVAECRGDSDRPTCKLDVAVVDANKVVGMIQKQLAKKKKRRAEVSCPEGPLVKAVGAQFQCMAVAKKKNIPVDVTVMDLDGRVSVALKT